MQVGNIWKTMWKPFVAYFEPLSQQHEVGFMIVHYKREFCVILTHSLFFFTYFKDDYNGQMEQ